MPTPSEWIAWLDAAITAGDRRTLWWLRQWASIDRDRYRGDAADTADLVLSLMQRGWCPGAAVDMYRGACARLRRLGWRTA